MSLRAILASEGLSAAQHEFKVGDRVQLRNSGKTGIIKEIADLLPGMKWTAKVKLDSGPEVTREFPDLIPRPKTANGDFEITSVPEKSVDDAVIRLPEGTRLLRNGKYIGKAVRGGYAFADGAEIVYIQINFANPRNNVTIRLPKRSFETIASV